MSEKEKNIPKRRFKEFENAASWKQSSIGKTGYFYYGKSAPKWSVTKDAKTPCVRYGELYTKYSEKINKIYSYTNIPNENLKFSTGKEVLVPRVGEDPLDFANCSWLSIPNVAIGEMISVYNTDQNPLFTAYMFNALFKHEFAKRVEGGNVSNLYYAYLEDIPVSFPSVDEQVKISNYLDSITKIITIQENKLEKLKSLKKAYLTEMFPDKEERKPKRRFANFSDDWEQRKFDEEVEFYSGLTYSPNDVSDTGTFVLRSSNVKNGEIVDADNVYVNSEIVNSNNVKEGDIIVVVRNGSRSLLGKHAQIKIKMDKTVIGAFMAGIRSSQSNFINALMDTQQFNKEIEKNLGATINQITNSMFREMRFMFPNIEEQKQIGNFFEKIDSLITLHQHKIDKLKNIKKAYLKEMFV